MSTIITADTVETECELNGIHDADVEALHALRSKGAKLTYMEFLMLMMQDAMFGAHDAMIELMLMVDKDDPHIGLLQDLRARLHAKSIARARGMHASYKLLAHTADIAVLTTGAATRNARVAEEEAVRAARDARMSIVYGETLLDEAMAAQFKI